MFSKFAEPSSTTNLVESLRCGICYGTYLKPSCLSCGHIFCTACLEALPDTRPLQCPTCRTLVLSKGATVIFGFDDVIDAVLHLLPQEVQEERRQRKRAAEEEQVSESLVKRKKRKTTRWLLTQYVAEYEHDDLNDPDLAQSYNEEDDTNDPVWLPSHNEEEIEDDTNDWVPSINEEENYEEDDPNDPDWLPSHSEEEYEEESEVLEGDDRETSSEEDDS